MKKVYRFLSMATLTALSACLLSACDESISTDMEALKQVDPPVIASFTPTSGMTGAEITIEGDHLGSIEEVWIGNEKVAIKSRITQRQLLVEVTGNAKTGKIKVRNTAGTAESEGQFTMEYVTPTLTDFPTSATIMEQVLLRGTHLQSVASVYFGNAQAKIVTQLPTELLVVMPTQPWGTSRVDVRLVYPSATGDAETGTTGEPVAVNFITPVFSGVPGKGNAGDIVTVLGENLGVIEKVYIDTAGMPERMEIPVLTATHNAFSFRLPDTLVFPVLTTVTLGVSFYSTQEVELHPAFNITIPGQETVYFWQNVTLECQKTTATNVFFVAQSGQAFSPCDYKANPDNLKAQFDFYVTWSSGNSALQLNNPNNSDQQAKNFRCDGETLPVEKLPKVVKFRVLDPNNTTQKDIIDKVKNQDIVKITPEMVNALPVAGTSAPRAYLSGTGSNLFKQGDVLLFQEFNGTTVLKTGFLDIVQVSFAATGNESTLTFNCYYQK